VRSVFCPLDHYHCSTDLLDCALGACGLLPHIESSLAIGTKNGSPTGIVAGCVDVSHFLDFESDEKVEEKSRLDCDYIQVTSGDFVRTILDSLATCLFLDLQWLRTKSSIVANYQFRLRKVSFHFTCSVSPISSTPD